MSLFSSTITVANLRADLTRIVDRFGKEHKATNPDPKNTATCIYFTLIDGVPQAVCIIGQWFASMGLLGLLNTDLTRPSDENIGNLDACSLDFSGWDRLAALGITVEKDAKRYAKHAQVGQDASLTWADALRYADAMMEHDALVEVDKTLGKFNAWGETTRQPPSTEEFDSTREPVSLVKQAAEEEDFAF